MKNIHFVVIQKHLQHDATKICFKWEREPFDNIKDETVLSTFQYEEKYAYKLVDKYEASLCPKCLWLYEPYHGSRSIVHDSLDIDFEANDSALLSKYWFTRLLKGRLDSTYNQEYGPIFVIQSYHIKKFLYELMHLSSPTEKDVEAMKVLSQVTTFLQKWRDHPDVVILQINED